MVLAAVEPTGPRLGRIRLVRVDDVRSETLVETLQSLVEPGSCIETDGLFAYRALAEAGYRHTILRADTREELLPQVHLAVSLLKRWLLGTHQGAVQVSHLDYYLDEFTLRARGLLFRRVLEHAVQVPPVREADLRAPK